MKINHYQKGRAIVTVGTTNLLLMEIGEHLTITSTNEYELLRFKKGSLSFRTNKGLKVRQAIKDLIQKAKSASTEIILIDVRD